MSGSRTLKRNDSGQDKHSSGSFKYPRSEMPLSATATASPSTNAPPVTSPELASPSDMPFQHDSKYYFEDGDIILRVSNTLFRVHREKLRAVKGLFEELFSLQQPADGEKIYGVPCCEISLVSATDMHFALGYIYEDVRLHFVDETKLEWFNWDATLALLRVGSRLSLHLLREKAVENLKMLFPTSLTKHGTPKNIQISLEKKERHRRMYAIEAINAAREFDVPSILPLAYYAAAQLSFSDIVKGVPREDGTRVQLQIADVLRVIQGREDLILSRRHTVFRFLSKFTDTGKPVPPSAHCPNVPMHTGETCFYALMRMNLDFNSSGYMESTASALDVMSEESREMIEMFLCESCWKMFRDAMYIGRGKNWKALPRYFGLGRWEAVVEAQEMADRHWKSDD